MSAPKKVNLITHRLDSIPTVQPLTFDISTADRGGYERFYKENGFVVLTNVVSRPQRRAFVVELVKKVLQQQPWKARFPFKVVDPVTNAELDIDRDTDRYLELLLSRNLLRSFIKALKEAGPAHTGFGAPCDNSSFQNDSVKEIRQDPRLYEAAAQLLGRLDLRNDVNRCIWKLPGEGQEEFMHLDVNPFEEGEPATAISGKVCITDSWFLCAPGTHTKEFHARFRVAYRELYPNFKPKEPKFALDPEKPDPEDIYGKFVALAIPEGSIIFWSDRLFHGVRKSPIDSHIQVGMYLGYMTAVDRPEYLAKAGIAERDDRIRSWREGLAPKLYPSLDPVYYMPKRFLNFPNIMEAYARKIPAGHPAVSTRVMKSGSRKGERVVHLVQVDSSSGEEKRLSTDLPYTPYPLSALGRKLLGLDPWV